jgi:hypothetical protein
VNVNGSGFTIPPGVQFPPSLDSTEVCEISVPYIFNAEAIVPDRSASDLQFALKTSEGIQYFRDSIDTRRIFTPSTLTPDTYLAFAARNQEALVIEVADGRVAEPQELGRRGFRVLAKAPDAISLGFAIAGRDMMCGIEVQSRGFRVTVRGERSFFGLVKDSAKYSFCRD